mgnify:FL=1
MKEGGEAEHPLQEYRLVPVDEWEEGGQQEEIDLVEVAKYFWTHKIFVAKVVGVSIVLGLLFVLLAPKNYLSQASLMPEFSEESISGNASNLLQKYGGLVGLDPGSYASNSNAIRVQLYPNIAESIPFQNQLLEEQVTSTEYDTTATLYTYFNDIYSLGPISWMLKYTIKLPFTLKNALFPSDNQQFAPAGTSLDSAIVSISEERMEVIEGMRKRVVVQLDDETGVVTVSAEMPEPVMSAKIANRAIEILTQYLVEYRTEKAKIDLKFAEEQLAKAKDRFNEAQLILAEFRDSNMGSLTAKARTKEQTLQSEYDIAFNLYNSLAQQYEQAKLRLQEETPVFKSLQPVQVPLEDTISGALVLFIVVFLGGMAALTWLTGLYLVREKKLFSS